MYRTGTLKVGDRILAINGESLYNKTVPEAVRMLNSAGDVVNLKISKATRRHSELNLMYVYHLITHSLVSFSHIPYSPS